MNSGTNQEIGILKAKDLIAFMIEGMYKALSHPYIDP